ncbi:MAG TPA: porin family protein [Saprospiraceae bacterium]|nr:porin family protein [Saprospiraceae bacterium]
MKTIRVFLSGMLMLTGLTWTGAQGNYGQFRWGLTAGANFANINNLDSIDEKNGIVGFTGGAFAKVPITTFMSLRPELLFSMKGGSFSSDNSPVGTLETRYNLSYIEVPLSLDFDLPFFIDIHAGLQGSFLVGNKVKLNGSTTTLNDDFFNNAEYGYHIGGGIDLGNIGIHARFQQSLSSFANSEGSFEPRNWGVLLIASYMFVN